MTEKIIKSLAEIGETTRTIPEYRIWWSMKQRCSATTRKDYEYYGGRGITVCDRWRDSFLNFYSDMGKRPIGFLLGRIDNNGPYSPENCRWETDRQQRLNKKTSRIITHNGRSQNVALWAEELGINRKTMTSWLNRGLTVEGKRP